MAVYRSDQAQLTFNTEAGAGGHPEHATSSHTLSGTNNFALTADHPAGSRSLAIGSVNGTIVAGDFV